MNYVCIENGQIIGVFNYQPEVPESVQVVEVEDSEVEKVKEGTHFFDTDGTVKPVPQSELDKKAQEDELRKANAAQREFLNSTDWKILRHIRQKSLGIATSLTEEEYLDLENQRQNAANSIINP